MDASLITMGANAPEVALTLNRVALGVFFGISGYLKLFNATRHATLARTMQEAGVPDFDITSWQGYFGPAGLPKEIVAKLNAEIRKIVEKPETKAQLATLGMDAFSGTPEELGTFVRDQLVLWEKLVTNAGIEKQ